MKLGTLAIATFKLEIMKNAAFIFIFTFSLCSGYAQDIAENGQSSFFRHVVLEASTVPFSFSTENDLKLTGFMYAAGYQVNEKLDMRFHVDRLLLQQEYPSIDADTYTKLVGLSIGGNYHVFQINKKLFIPLTGISFAGKVGITATVDEMEQQSVFFDLSARTMLGRYAFLSLGLNQHFGSFLGLDPVSDATGFFYFSFGINL
jgi:hypothetical protein